MAELSALLAREASTEIEAIDSEAQSRVSELLANAREEAEALVTARQRTAASQREAVLMRARSAAQLEASSLKLRAQHEAVEAVFDGVRSKLEDLVASQDSYAPIFAKLLAEAVAGLGGQQLEAVEVAPAEVEVAKAALGAAGIEAGVEPSDAVRGGVRLRTARHSVIENSLFGRLESLKGELAAEVSKALFGAGAS